MFITRSLSSKSKPQKTVSVKPKNKTIHNAKKKRIVNNNKNQQQPQQQPPQSQPQSPQSHPEHRSSN